MDYLYAQMDENNVCIGISQLSGEVMAENMIALSDNEFSINKLLCRYENGSWIAVE